MKTLLKHYNIPFLTLNFSKQNGVNCKLSNVLVEKRELVALLNLSSWCLVMVEWLFLAVPWGCLRFVIVIFPDHTHLIFFMTDYRLMQVKVLQNALREHSAILSTCIKLPSVFKTFVLSNFEWPLKTCFTVDTWRLLQEEQNVEIHIKKFLPSQTS